jgi:succinate dehydrogenase/fumarate reductase flavoprotein subunit
MARAIAGEKTGPFGGVFLDLAGNVQRTGPIYREVLALGRRSALDAVQFAYGRAEAACEVPWEVIPTFHYHPGGVRVDERCQSTVSGLYAIGQVMGGLFGADRLGSVSLTELFLFGKIAAENAVQDVLNQPRGPLDRAKVEDRVKEKACLRGTQGAVRPVEIKRRLQTLMREKVGFVREKDGLEKAIRELDLLDEQKECVRVSPYENFNTDWIDCLELSSMIRLGRIIARCALEREESRGGHLRIDHPERDEGRWLKTLVIRKTEEGMLLRADSLEGVWDHIEPRRRIEEARPRILETLLRSLPDALVERIMRNRMKRFL